ncbi:MAG: hypothetical protein JO366_09705, partial [Methylobacteriaceae bacterium]|nr:hypothetical protein [Methylobacteriaceae bacterium]
RGGGALTTGQLRTSHAEPSPSRE